jgi:hypothetical protein
MWERGKKCAKLHDQVLTRAVVLCAASVVLIIMCAHTIYTHLFIYLNYIIILLSLFILFQSCIK